MCATVGVTAYSPIFLMSTVSVHTLPSAWHGKIIECTILLLFRAKLIVWMERKFKDKAQKQWVTYNEQCCSTTHMAFVRRIFVALFFICTTFT
jgi:hypothetical protein